MKDLLRLMIVVFFLCGLLESDSTLFYTVEATANSFTPFCLDVVFDDKC